VNRILYADDTALVSDKECKLQKRVRNLGECVRGEKFL
jgi:hypothetical protein